VAGFSSVERGVEFCADCGRDARSREWLAALRLISRDRSSRPPLGV